MHGQVTSDSESLSASEVEVLGVCVGSDVNRDLWRKMPEYRGRIYNRGSGLWSDDGEMT